MTGDFWIARTPTELRERVQYFVQHCDSLPADQWPVCWKAEKYKHPRSLDQNSLLHKWCREYAVHLLKRDDVTEDEKEAMRITLQRACYAATGWDWLIEHVPDLFSGETKPQRRSTRKMDKGEMHLMLNWIQQRAAEDGLILESLGEYRELQESQVA
jgi:hypothetical protein